MKIGKIGGRLGTGLIVGAAVLTGILLRQHNNKNVSSEQTPKVYNEEYVVKKLNSQLDSIVKAKTDSIANLSIPKSVSSVVKDTVPSKTYFDASQLLGDSIKNVIKSVK